METTWRAQEFKVKNEQGYLQQNHVDNNYYVKNMAEHSCYSFKCYAILTVLHKLKVSALKNFLIIIKSVLRHNKQESKLA